MFSSRENVATLGLYEGLIQIKCSDFGMVDGCEVNPVERGILDTLKETEWCRGVTEDGVRWVRMAMLGACPRYRALEYLLLFVTVVDAEPAST